MRFVVLVHGRNLDGVEFAPNRPNPGVGGTQFTRVRLADSFARRFPEHEVEVVSDYHMKMSNAPANLTVRCAQFEDFLRDLSSDVDDWVLTAPSMLLRQLQDDVLRAVAKRTIVTSHLMHDADLWEVERAAKFGAAGCVGAYHFHSSRSRSPKVYLRNLFLPGWEQHPAPSSTRSRDDPFRIVHVGALLPLKGFDDLAKIWPEIVELVPTATLDVIGGADVYAGANDHPVLPTTKAFGDRILQFLPEEAIQTSQVRFHGRLGADKTDIIASADVAVLNVANRQESLCAALFECLDLGTPVVGSSSNGLWDSMRYFPELTSRQPQDVPYLLSEILQKPELLAELSRRAQHVAADFRSENNVIVERWELVGQSLLENRTPPSFAPEPRPKSAARLWSTWARRRGRYEFRRSPMGRAIAAAIRRTG